MDICGDRSYVLKSDLGLLVRLVNGDIFAVSISEGSGDNLLREDRREGFIDYAEWSSYMIREDGLYMLEGGMVLYREYYADMALEDIIRSVLEESYDCQGPEEVSLLEGITAEQLQYLAGDLPEEMPEQERLVFQDLLRRRNDLQRKSI